MKGIADPYAYRLQGVEGDRKTLFLTFAVSGICHLLLFAIFIFFPNRAWDRKSPPSFINVSIVTLSALEKGPTPYDKPSIEPEKQATTQKKRSTPTAKAIPVAAQKPSEAISVQKKTKKPKRSLKKKTFKTAKVVKSAIDKIEKSVEESRPDQITRAIDRLRGQVKKNGIAEQKKHQDEKSLGISSGPGSNSKKVLELIDIYKVEIRYRIQKNWVFSEQLAGGGKDLEAVVIIKIMQNGEIKDSWFEKRSGNRYLDESANKAIMKSNPLPPLPKGYLRSSYTVGIQFYPEGIK